MWDLIGLFSVHFIYIYSMSAIMKSNKFALEYYRYNPQNSLFSVCFIFAFVVLQNLFSFSCLFEKLDTPTAFIRVFYKSIMCSTVSICSESKCFFLRISSET